MTITADHNDLVTILNNNLTINNAILSVASSVKKDVSGKSPIEIINDMRAVLEEVIRSHQLILQALKSNTAIINQIRERNFPLNTET